MNAMKNLLTKSALDRRAFLLGIAPVCAATCLGPTCLQVAGAFAQTDDQTAPDVHKFDKPFPRELTIQQFFDAEYKSYIPLAKALKKEMGDEKLIRFIKDLTEKQMFELGQKQAEQGGDNSFGSFVGRLKRLDPIVTMDIVEESDSVFEIKVTECVFAETFLKSDAGDIGFAAVCYGDYAWPRGYNGKMKMIRDKTLMEGHSCCNHRYVLEA
jgi:hypothetical protein